MENQSTDWLVEPYEEIDEWDVVTSDRCHVRHKVFLSGREEDKNREAFIVAEEQAVCDLLDER